MIDHDHEANQSRPKRSARRLGGQVVEIGTVALSRSVPRGSEQRPVSGSDRAGEFADLFDAAMRARVDTEFVVPAADVLHQRMTAHDHSSAVVALESAHWSEPGFESAVVAFDAVVRVLLSVVKRGRDEAFDRSLQCRGPIGHDLDRFTMRAECRAEEPSCCSEVASRGDEYVDDLTVLINGPVDVTRFAGDLM